MEILNSDDPVFFIEKSVRDPDFNTTHTVEFECFRSSWTYLQKQKSGVPFESSIPKENGWDFKRRKGTRQEKETFYKEEPL